MRRVGRNEQGMVEPAPHERHLHIVAIPSELGACGGDVLAILLTARVGVLRRSDETDGVTQACGAEVTKRVWQERMPVAHADVDRKRMTRGCEATLQSVRLPSGDVRDRRHAAEELVVASHFIDALGADASAAENVRQERADVVGPLGPAERDDENGVE